MPGGVQVPFTPVTCTPLMLFVPVLQVTVGLVQKTPWLSIVTPNFALFAGFPPFVPAPFTYPPTILFI
jgi:hypothetical protein